MSINPVLKEKRKKKGFDPPIRGLSVPRATFYHSSIFSKCFSISNGLITTWMPMEKSSSLAEVRISSRRKYIPTKTWGDCTSRLFLHTSLYRNQALQSNTPSCHWAPTATVQLFDLIASVDGEPSNFLPFLLEQTRKLEGDTVRRGYSREAGGRTQFSWCGAKVEEVTDCLYCIDCVALSDRLRHWVVICATTLQCVVS